MRLLLKQISPCMNKVKPTSSFLACFQRRRCFFTNCRKNIARPCNFLITRQIFTEYCHFKNSSKVLFLFITLRVTFARRRITFTSAIIILFIVELHYKIEITILWIVIRFPFPMKSVSQWIIPIAGRSVFQGRWSASTKMAAFVAKQMVGNKLNAVKGEFCIFSAISRFVIRSVENFPVAPISTSDQLLAIIHHRSSSFRGKIAFQPFRKRFHRVAGPIKGGTEEERSGIDCYCCVTGPNAITVRRLTANLLIYVARKSLISV